MTRANRTEPMWSAICRLTATAVALATILGCRSSSESDADPPPPPTTSVVHIGTTVNLSPSEHAPDSSTTLGASTTTRSPVADVTAAGASIAPLTVEARVDLPGLGTGLASDAGSLWVSTLNNKLVRIDPATNAVASVIDWPGELEGGGEMDNWVVVGEGSVWVTDEANRAVHRVDPAAGTVVATIPIESPWSITVGAGDVWIPDFAPYSVARLDAEINQIEARIPATGPTDVAEGAGSIWIVAHRSNELIRIDPATNQAIATIPLGTRSAQRVAFGHDAIWVTDGLSNAVVRVDPATNAVTAVVPMPDGIIATFEITTGADAVWVASDGDVLRIDPTTNTVDGRLQLGVDNEHCGEARLSIRCLKDIAVADGSVWVGYAVDNTLIRISPE